MLGANCTTCNSSAGSSAPGSTGAAGNDAAAPGQSRGYSPNPPRFTYDHAHTAIGSMVLQHYGRWVDENRTSALFPCPLCGIFDSLQLVPQGNGSIKAECLSDAGCKKSTLAEHLKETWGLGLRRRAPAKPRNAPPAVENGEQRSLGYRYSHWYSNLDEYRGRLRYVPQSGAWWKYDDLVWQPVPTNNRELLDSIINNRFLMAHRLNEQGAQELADQLVNEKWLESQVRSPYSDMQAGLRAAFGGPEPVPDLHLVGTPNCVIDLRTLATMPHAPEYNLRALTAGRYLPETGGDLLDALQGRFAIVFEPETLRAFLQLVGLALSGQAQQYRGITLVTGRSGTGKGGAIKSMQAALGDYAMGVSLEWIKARPHGDIDTVGAEILAKIPRVVVSDEMGGDDYLQSRRVNEITGGTQRYSARKAHGTLLEGEYIFMLVGSAVDAPLMAAHAGIRRRLAVLPTVRDSEIEGDEIDTWGGASQSLLDAIVTLAVREATLVYQSGYKSPEGNTAAKRSMLDEMDPLNTWLEGLPDNYHGTPTKDVLAEAREHLGNDRITQTAMGRTIKGSSRWHKDRLNHSSPVALLLKPGAGPLLADK